MKTLSFIVGIIAFIFFVFSLIQKNKKRILVLQIIANILYAVQYSLLLVFTPAIMNIINITRSYWYYKDELNHKKTPLWVLIMFIVIIFVVTIFIYDGYLSLVPPIITSIYAIATYQNNLKILRLTFMICACIWIIFNYSVGAYSGIIGNVFEIVFGTIGLIINKDKTK